MIYEKSNQYYLKQGDKYFIADIIVKSHTIVISPTNEYVTELSDFDTCSYEELKEYFLSKSLLKAKKDGEK